PGAAEGREVALELAHFGPIDELAMPEHARDRVVDPAAQPAALRRDIDEWERRVETGVLIHICSNDARYFSRRPCGACAVPGSRPPAGSAWQLQGWRLLRRR